MVKPILSTFNIQDSINFYVNILSHQLNWKTEDEQGNPNFASLRLGDSEIMLGTIDFVEEEDRQRLGKGIQLYIIPPHEIPIQTLYENAKTGNVKIIKPLERREWGEWAFVMNDPNGYNLMVAQEEKP